MLVTDFSLRISGRPGQYVVQLQAGGEADSVAAIREVLRPLVGNLRLTTAEVDADLASIGSYEAHSLPTEGRLEDPAELERHAAQP
jgi:hypothetical protein